MSPDTVAQGSKKGRNNHQGKAGDCEESTYPENQREKTLLNQWIQMKQMLLIKIVTTKIIKQKCRCGQVDLYSTPNIAVSGMNPVAATPKFIIYHYSENFNKKDLPTLLEISLPNFKDHHEVAHR